MPGDDLASGRTIFGDPPDNYSPTEVARATLGRAPLAALFLAVRDMIGVI